MFPWQPLLSKARWVYPARCDSGPSEENFERAPGRLQICPKETHGCHEDKNMKRQSNGKHPFTCSHAQTPSRCHKTPDTETSFPQKIESSPELSELLQVPVLNKQAAYILLLVTCRTNPSEKDRKDSNVRDESPQAGQCLWELMHAHNVTAAHPEWKDPDSAKTQRKFSTKHQIIYQAFRMFSLSLLSIWGVSTITINLLKVQNYYFCFFNVSGYLFLLVAGQVLVHLQDRCWYTSMVPWHCQGTMEQGNCPKYPEGD